MRAGWTRNMSITECAVIFMLIQCAPSVAESLFPNCPSIADRNYCQYMGRSALSTTTYLV